MFKGVSCAQRGSGLPVLGSYLGKEDALASQGHSGTHWPIGSTRGSSGQGTEQAFPGAYCEDKRSENLAHLD